MSRSALTGSRIRARRMDMGLRQSDLARACGISPSYLNLIEHNRRRIGGKLLVDIARTLQLEVSALSQGADRTLIEDLRAAAEGVGIAEAADRAEEFAGRFPDWARVLTEQSRRVGELERALETLSDRLGHDPHLATSLHDVLTTAAAIHSTSAILAEQGVDPAWQARFHRNLNEDSRRLADASRALASYLDAGGDSSRSVLSPQEEFHGWLESQAFELAWIEAGAPENEDGPRIADAPALGSSAAQGLARAHVTQYRADAARMPRAAVLDLVHERGPDPEACAAAFGAGYPAVFRRLAALADAAGIPSLGLAVCDGSGTMVLRKPAEGFPLPLFGGACPLWPLYQSLARPHLATRDLVELVGRAPRHFTCYTVAESRPANGFGGPQVVHAHMLILPAADSSGGTPAAPVGTSCRICPRTACPARREPSVIGVLDQARPMPRFDRP
jgi:predicted transcriptional regulator/DNA-binding XRE family transcriptional regulator